MEMQHSSKQEEFLVSLWQTFLKETGSAAILLLQEKATNQSVPEVDADLTHDCGHVELGGRSNKEGADSRI